MRWRLGLVVLFALAACQSEELGDELIAVVAHDQTIIATGCFDDTDDDGNAIFNAKGFAHDWGFERYSGMEAHNLRAQVAVEDLARKVSELKADAVLVSRVVTQRDEHVVELKNFLEALKKGEGVAPHLVKICGGPRISHQEATSWGYDAGFGPGTKPSQVASFIVHELVKRGVK